MIPVFVLIRPSINHPFPAGPLPALLAALLGIVMVIVLALPLLDHPPEYDELLHVLAARGVDQTGTPSIADGTYERARLYTWIIAHVNGTGLGELVGARLPALAAGAALAALVGAWIGWRVGWLAGMSTVAVLAIFPVALHSAVLVRFYTLHSLTTCAFVIGVYELSRATRWQRPGAAVTGLILLALPALLYLGWQLHELTLIALLAALGALGAVILHDARVPLNRTLRRHPLAAGAVLVVALAALVLIAWQADAVELLRGAPAPWSDGRANYVGFYLGALGHQMPFFWPAFPIMAVAALFGRPRLSLFCLVFVVAGLAANSLAAQKATRYVHQLLPFVCALWGIGLQTLILHGARAIAMPRGLSVLPVALVLLAVVGFSISTTNEVRRSLKLLLGQGVSDDTIPVLDEPDWSRAVDVLQPSIDAGDTVIVSSGVKGLFFLGDYDLELNASVVKETESGDEFGVDPRSGRRVIGSAESVRRTIAGEGSELFVLETRKLNQPYGTDTEVVGMLNRRCTPVIVPPSAGLSVWRCI